MNTKKVTIWKTLLNNVNWYYFKILIFQMMLKIRNPLQIDYWAYLKVTYLFQNVGCVRSNYLCHTAQSKLKLVFSTQDYEWTEFPRLIFRICYLKYDFKIQMKKKSSYRIKESCLLLKYQGRNCLIRRILLNYRRLILSPQTQSVHMKNRSCIFWKVMEKKSRWWSKSEVLIWDMFQEPIEMYMIDSSTESI